MTNFTCKTFISEIENRQMDAVEAYLRDSKKRKSISRFLNDTVFQTFIDNLDTEYDTERFLKMISAFKNKEIPS